MITPTPPTLKKITLQVPQFLLNFRIFKIVGGLHKKGKYKKYWKYIWYYVSPNCYITHIYV